MDIKEAIVAATEAQYSEKAMPDSITYNGTPILGHIEDGSERIDASVASIGFSVRVQKKDVSRPKIDDKVIYDGTQYRVGEGFYLSGGDWLLPLIIDYIEV